MKPPSETMKNVHRERDITDTCDVFVSPVAATRLVYGVPNYTLRIGIVTPKGGDVSAVISYEAFMRLVKHAQSTLGRSYVRPPRG